MFKLTPFTARTPRRKDDIMDFADIVEDFFNTPFRGLRQDTFRIDVEEKEDAYYIKADLPGIKKDEVKVSYDDQILNIEVTKDEEKDQEETEERNYIHRERRYASMRRAIHLPDVDPGKLKAKLEDGVLNVKAEKTEVKDQGYVVEVE